MNPVVLPAAPHVDGKEFPALTPSPHSGIGGIPGSKDFPKGTFEGFQAFQKPDKGTVVPCSAAGKTVTKSTTTTTVSTSSPVVTTTVSTTSTATSSVPSSNLLNGRKEQEPNVSVSQMSRKQMDEVHANLAAKANLSKTGQVKAKGKGPTTEKPLDTDSATTSSRQTRQSSRTTKKTLRSHSSSTARGMDWKGVGGKGLQLGLLLKVWSPRRVLARRTPMS